MVDQLSADVPDGEQRQRLIQVRARAPTGETDSRWEPQFSGTMRIPTASAWQVVRGRSCRVISTRVELKCFYLTPCHPPAGKWKTMKTRMTFPNLTFLQGSTQPQGKDKGAQRFSNKSKMPINEEGKSLTLKFGPQPCPPARLLGMRERPRGTKDGWAGPP